MEMNVKLGDEVFFKTGITDDKFLHNRPCIVQALFHRLGTHSNEKDMRIIPINDDGSVDMNKGIKVLFEEVEQTRKIKLFAYVTKSNKIVLLEELINGSTSKNRVSEWDRELSFKLLPSKGNK